MEEEKTIEQQLEEANKKIEELTHINKQYEDLMRESNIVYDDIIENFNNIVGGIRCNIDEGFIRKNYKGIDFTNSKEIPVYIYKNTILKHIGSFLNLVRKISNHKKYCTGEKLNRKDYRMTKDIATSIKKYYKYILSQ